VVRLSERALMRASASCALSPIKAAGLKFLSRDSAQVRSPACPGESINSTGLPKCPRHRRAREFWCSVRHAIGRSLGRRFFLRWHYVDEHARSSRPDRADLDAVISHPVCVGRLRGPVTLRSRSIPQVCEAPASVTASASRSKSGPSTPACERARAANHLAIGACKARNGKRPPTEAASLFYFRPKSLEDQYRAASRVAAKSSSESVIKILSFV
jgi:hypothetical protein